jgi:hypothetical protein
VDEDRLALALLAVAMLAAAVLVLVLTRKHNLSEDDLNFLVNRGGTKPDVFLDPNNEHAVVAPMLVYKTLFRVFGVDSYLPYRLAVLALHLLCVGLLYALARRSLGPLPALVPAVALLFLGAAWEAVLQLALIVFLLPFAAGLGALLALDRDDRRGDLIASGCLLVALFSGSLGVVMTIGAVVLILLGPDPVRRLARVVVVPGVLYALWRVGYSDSRMLGEWSDVPRLGVRYLASSVAALAGFKYSAAPILWTALAAVLAAAVAYSIFRRRAGWQSLAAVAAMTVSYWVLVVLFRPAADQPPSRYLYAGPAFLLLLGAGVVGRRRFHPPAAAAAVVVLTLLVVSQIGDFRDGARTLDRRADFLSASLGALELARPHVEYTFEPDPTRAPGILAGRYFAATDAYGSPADDPHELAARPELARRAADIVATIALDVKLQPGALPRVGGSDIHVDGGSVRPARGHPGCLVVALGGRGGRPELSVPAAGMTIREPGERPVRLRVRRFADGYGPDYDAPGAGFFPLRVFRRSLVSRVLVLAAHDSGVLRIPADSSSVPWHLRVAGRGSVVVCGSPP